VSDLLTNELLAAPTNLAAEWATLSQMLCEPSTIGEVIGVPLERQDFSTPVTQALYSLIVERYYAGAPVDPLIIGELARDELAQHWSADRSAVAQLLVGRVRDAQVPGSVIEHAAIVKRLSTARRLSDVCYRALRQITAGQLTPEEVGDVLSTEALQVTSGTMRRSELLSWMDVGREYAQQLSRVREARTQGIEVGVYTGLSFIDNWTSGIGPGELCFLAGEPGVGKTALAVASAMGFAARQVQRPAEQRVTTLVLSMEMNLYSSTARLVSMLTGIEGPELREGSIDDRDYQRFLTEWRNREHLPIMFNFASNFRLSQMRALIAEAIRRANVGFVVIDHFRMIDTDRRYQNANDVDEARVRFLKESIAKDLNVAVMCLAHTVKVGRGQAGESPQPRLSDLRGSGMIAAFADFIAMAWRPPTFDQDDPGAYRPDDEYELWWVKNRFGEPSSAPYRFEAPIMRVSAR
jgi:replicative DNA helicase